MNTVITILSFAFVLGVLVFVHELGHFLAAKRVGIRVLKFQLGFNPTMLLSIAGTRPLPAVSVPSASGTSPAETATAEPELEPPGMRSPRSGLCGMP